MLYGLLDKIGFQKGIGDRSTPRPRKEFFSNLLNFEVDGDLRLNLDRLAVEIIRFISPLPHSLKGSGREQKRSAQHFRIYDMAFLVDRSFDLHHALGMGRQRISRILRFHALNEKSLRYSL